MNQILMTENKKKKQRSSGPLEIKGIVRFFAIVIMIFGITLASEGTYAIFKDVEDRKPANMPSVTISRLNDKLILYVEHSVEISKIIYSWNNGENTVIPEGGITAQEEILLPNQNSVLNITVEDMNGKQVKYQKEYLVEGMDITKPTIKIDVANGNKKMTITAIDDTEIASLTYKWEGEDEVEVKATTSGQTQIVQEVDLMPGTRKISIIAEDKNGNVEKIEREIVATTSEPKMQILKDGKKIIIEASDEDGVKDIKINLNGKEYAAKDIKLKRVKVGPIELKEGNNIISIEVTNVSGYSKKAATEIQYTP